MIDVSVPSEFLAWLVSAKHWLLISYISKTAEILDGYAFIDDIDKELEWHQLCHLRENLLCKLLDVASLDERAYSWENYLRNKKLFIVLDNVTDKKQIDVLIGEKSLYRQGTRIVIITRDKKLLQNQADATYVVPRLNDREAMELFCLKAFAGNLFPPEEFMDLSYSFVDYSKGHPLALTLLGSDLLGNDKTYWSEKWKSLKVMPDKEIQKVLEKSYEKLDDKQKSIFLDSMFFQVGRKRFRFEHPQISSCQCCSCDERA
uniref:NB-ARC domain-containing protein n=1 Tax=Brassica oleracea TaxID=3712 RepID=A0A3P6E732_BRAOL|nr:unnamed protein product [Brassica oleracea]